MSHFVSEGLQQRGLRPPDWFLPAFIHLNERNWARGVNSSLTPSCLCLGSFRPEDASKDHPQHSHLLHKQPVQRRVRSDKRVNFITSVVSRDLLLVHLHLSSECLHAEVKLLPSSGQNLQGVRGNPPTWPWRDVSLCLVSFTVCRLPAIRWSQSSTHPGGAGE